VLAVLVLVLTLAGDDSVTVTQVFGGHGAAEYNKWLYSNAKEYQGLAPIHVQIDSSVRRDTWWYSYYVSFLNGRGDVTRSRVFSGEREREAIDGYGKWLDAQTSDNGAALLVSPCYGQTTVYNRHGDSVFTVTGGPLSGNGGFFFHVFCDDEAYYYRDYIEVLDSRGRLLDTIGRLAEPSVHAHVWSRNRTHALYVSDTAGRVLVVDKNGRMLWQVRLSYQTDADVAISEDARFVAVATWDSLIVRDVRAGRTFTRSLYRRRHGEYVAPNVAISADNRYVAVARSHASKHDSCALDIFSAAAVCTSMVLHTGSVVDVGFVGDRLGIVALAPTEQDTGVPRVPPSQPRRPPSAEPYRIVVVGLDGHMQTWEGIGPSHPYSPSKLVGNALAFYGKDSIYVYRIETAPTQQRK
jgi:hypothetical protein